MLCLSNSAVCVNKDIDVVYQIRSCPHPLVSECDYEISVSENGPFLLIYNIVRRELV